MTRQLFGRKDPAPAVPQGATREAILEGLLKGEITPAGAQAAAERLEIGSLTDPDPTLFDPMAKSFWTIPMALAWIASHSLDRVRVLMDEYRAACFEFVPIHGGGGSTTGWYKRRARPRRSTLEHATQLLGRAQCEAAQLVLREALMANGKPPLQATATPAIGGERNILPANVWTEVVWCDHKDGVYTRKKDSPFRYVHTSVQMRRADILARWPEPPGQTPPAKETAGTAPVEMKAPANHQPAKAPINKKAETKPSQIKTIQPAKKPRAPKRSAAEAAAEQVLIHWMARNPEMTPFAKAKWEEGAMAKWPGLSRAAFGRAWTAAVKKTGAAAWNKGGGTNAARGTAAEAVPPEYFDV